MPSTPTPPRRLTDPVEEHASSSKQNGSRVRSESPARVLSPENDVSRSRPLRKRFNSPKQKYPKVQDETEFKNLLQVNRGLLTKFAKQQLKQNETLHKDFMTFLEDSLKEDSSLRDSEIYSKLRTFLEEQDFEFEKSNRYNTHTGDIRSVLPNTKFYPETVLDVGCGEGIVTAGLKNDLVSTKRVVGVDYHDIRAEKHKDKFEFLLLNRGDAFKLETVKDESVDLVVCVMSLHLMENLDSTLDELRRVMKKGAFLVIREHDCFKDEVRLFLDVVHGLHSLVFTDTPVEESSKFCQSFKAHYRSKRQWELILEQKKLFHFKSTTQSGLFFSYYASFKKDERRGASSRKRTLSMRGGPGPHGAPGHMGGPPPPPPGMGPRPPIPPPYPAAGGVPPPHPAMDPRAPHNYQQHGGPPFKRRRFNGPGPQSGGPRQRGGNMGPAGRGRNNMRRSGSAGGADHFAGGRGGPQAPYGGPPGPYNGGAHQPQQPQYPRHHQQGPHYGTAPNGRGDHQPQAPYPPQQQQQHFNQSGPRASGGMHHAGGHQQYSPQPQGGSYYQNQQPSAYYPAQQPNTGAGSNQQWNQHGAGNGASYPPRQGGWNQGAQQQHGGWNASQQYDYGPQQGGNYGGAPPSYDQGGAAGGQDYNQYPPAGGYNAGSNYGGAGGQNYNMGGHPNGSYPNAPQGGGRGGGYPQHAHQQPRY